MAANRDKGGWHSKGCERATRAIGGGQSSLRGTTVIMIYGDQPASRVGIRLVPDKADIYFNENSGWET